MKKTNYLLIPLIMICLIFTGSVSAQNYYKDKYSMAGYSYSMDGNKIEDITVKIIESNIKDGNLSGKAVLITSTDSILMEFNNLKLKKLPSGESKDYMGVGIAHTKEGNMDLAIAIDKNLDRIAGSIDYPDKKSIRVYSFLAGKDIPSPDLIKERINSYNGSSFSDISQDVSITGIGKLADSTVNGIHVQVYGPSTVHRGETHQPYQIRARQNIYPNQTWITISYIKIWANSPLNGGEGFTVVDINPHSKSYGSISIPIPYLGITVNTEVMAVIADNGAFDASWTINPLGDATDYYDGPESNQTPTAVAMLLTPIAGSGTYICTGWVSAEFKFWDSVNRYYDTRTNSNIPYYVTVTDK